MFNPYNPVQGLRNAILIGNQEFVNQQLEKVDLLKHGDEVIQACIKFKKPEMLQFFLDKGCNILHPPDSISKTFTEDQSEVDAYRKSPFIIQAAVWGDLKTFKLVEANCLDTNETGHVLLSKKRKNSVISNVIGAAAHAGNASVLKYLLTRAFNVNLEAIEKTDPHSGKSAFQKEMIGYTPVMLAIVGGDKNADVIKLLL